jgi:hypothetical protein
VKDDRVYLQHIQDALNDIASYCGSDRDGFFSDRMRQDATLRKLEVIGQAVKNLSEGTKSRQPDSLEADCRHGAELIGEMQYGDTYRLAYIRGPEGIIVALAEQLG